MNYTILWIFLILIAVFAIYCTAWIIEDTKKVEKNEMEENIYDIEL